MNFAISSTEILFYLLVTPVVMCLHRKHNGDRTETWYCGVWIFRSVCKTNVVLCIWGQQRGSNRNTILHTTKKPTVLYGFWDQCPNDIWFYVPPAAVLIRTPAYIGSTTRSNANNNELLYWFSGLPDQCPNEIRSYVSVTTGVRCIIKHLDTFCDQCPNEVWFWSEEFPVVHTTLLCVVWVEPHFQELLYWSPLVVHNTTFVFGKLERNVVLLSSDHRIIMPKEVQQVSNRNMAI